MTGFASAQLLTNIVAPCIGDDIIYTCTLNTLGHVWQDSEFIGSVLLSTPSPTSEGVYTLRRVAFNSTSIVSTLSVTASTGLNGTEISCRDGHGVIETIQRQEITVLGESINIAGNISTNPGFVCPPPPPPSHLFLRLWYV